MIHLETDRWLMRPMTPSDAKGMFLLDSDPEVHKYLGLSPVTTLEESEEMLNDVLQQYKDYGIGRSAVIDKASGEFMGWSGLKYETTVRDYPYYDVGYRLRKKFWGKGIATETAAASLKYGFEELGYDVIEGGAHVENAASNHILKKIGLKFTDEFLFEGMRHNWYKLSKADYKG